MSDDYSKLVWSDEKGDLRSKKESSKKAVNGDTSGVLKLRRVTAGKGRSVIEISGLPPSEDQCRKLAQELKAHLACGGTFKNGLIEIHGEQFEKLTAFLDKKGIKWKKTGG